MLTPANSVEIDNHSVQIERLNEAIPESVWGVRLGVAGNFTFERVKFIGMIRAGRGRLGRWFTVDAKPETAGRKRLTRGKPKPLTRNQFLARCANAYDSGKVTPEILQHLEQCADLVMRLTHTVLCELQGNPESAQWSNIRDTITMEVQRIAESSTSFMATLANDAIGYGALQFANILRHSCQRCATAPDVFWTRGCFGHDEAESEWRPIVPNADDYYAQHDGIQYVVRPVFIPRGWLYHVTIWEEVGGDVIRVSYTGEEKTQKAAQAAAEETGRKVASRVWRKESV